MGRARYQVACSVDGYFAGPNDDFNWITPEPTFDFDALCAQFDTLPMGRPRLSLTGHRACPGGIVLVEYAVQNPTDQAVTG